MRCLVFIVLAAELLALSGCTAILDKLSTDYYQQNYFADISVEELDEKSQPEPDIQQVAMRHHDDEVDSIVFDGWEVLGLSESHTASPLRPNHPGRKARRPRAGRVRGSAGGRAAGGRGGGTWAPNGPSGRRGSGPLS